MFYHTCYWMKTVLFSTGGAEGGSEGFSSSGIGGTGSETVFGSVELGALELCRCGNTIGLT